MLLKHAPIQAKTELLKEVEANAQAASQQAQKMEELQMQQLDIQNKLSEAEIVSKLSLSTEREARAKADIGLLIERTSESKQNQSEAVLNQVKVCCRDTRHGARSINECVAVCYGTTSESRDR